MKGRFLQSNVTDAKRAVRHYVYREVRRQLKGVLADRPASVLALAGEAFEEDFGQLQSSFDWGADVIFVDRNRAVAAKMRESGLPFKFAVCDLGEGDRNSPVAVLAGRRFDFVNLDFCGHVTSATVSIARRMVRNHLAAHGMVAVSFSYGREVDGSGSTWARAGTRFLRARGLALNDVPDVPLGVLGRATAFLPQHVIRLVLNYRGRAMPLGVVLYAGPKMVDTRPVVRRVGPGDLRALALDPSTIGTLPARDVAAMLGVARTTVASWRANCARGVRRPKPAPVATVLKTHKEGLNHG